MINEDLTNRIKKELRAETNIMECTEYRSTMVAISDIAADVVKKTLGPYGTTTVVEDGTATYPTKDGLHTLQNLRFGDGVYNTLYGVMMQPCRNSANRVGDGTTTAMVVSNYLMNALDKYMSSHPNVRQSDIIDTLNQISVDIISHLKSSPDLTQIDKDGDFTDIYNVAMISSNGNIQISKMIQEIYQKTMNPDIYIDMSALLESHMEIQTGYQFNCRPIYLKPYINSDEGAFKISEGADVYFFDHAVNYTDHKNIISAISNYANARGTQAIIFSPTFDSIVCKIITDAIDAFVLQGKMPVITLIQLPYVTSMDKWTYEDLRILTACQIFDYPKVKVFNRLMAEQMGQEVEKTVEDSLYGTDAYEFKTPQEIIQVSCGRVHEMSITHKNCVITDYNGIPNKQLLDNHIKEVKEEYEKAKEKVNYSTNILQKDYLQTHLHYVRLSGSMGRILIGGNSVEEKKYMYDIVEDAVSACRAAFNDGTVRGMNITILQTILNMIIESDHYDLYRDMLSFIYHAFDATCQDIFKNKYRIEDLSTIIIEPDVSEVPLNIRNSIKDRTDITSVLPKAVVGICGEFDMTYNIVTNRMEYGKQHWTVINPVTTEIEIVRSTIGILSTVFTSNQFLSTRRHYDKIIVREMKEQEEKEKIEQDYEIKGRSFATGVMKAITGIYVKNI